MALGIGRRRCEDLQGTQLFFVTLDIELVRENKPTPKKRLLTEVRELLRTRHYSYVTEKGYVSWIRRFILHFDKQPPRALGPNAIGEYLTYLAVQRQVSSATQNQALNALVFLYREVLKIDLTDIPGIAWAKHRERIPIVFSREQVSRILAELPRSQRLIASLLYGSGLRLAECLRLRVKDIDFERRQVAVWDSKSMKDRLTILPQAAYRATERTSQERPLAP